MRERGNLNEIVVAPGRAARRPLHAHDRARVPGRRAHGEGLPLQGARLVPARARARVCQGCATGCNAFLDYDPRYNKVYRYRPRENVAVNKYWMCDDGMLDYHRATRAACSRRASTSEDATLGAALDRAAKALKGVAPETLAVVLSAQHSIEDNFALLELARDVLGAGDVLPRRKARRRRATTILRHPDKNPNTRGVAALAHHGAAALDAGSRRARRPWPASSRRVLALGSDDPRARRRRGALAASKNAGRARDARGSAVASRDACCCRRASWAEVRRHLRERQGPARRRASRRSARRATRGRRGSSSPGSRCASASDLGWRKLADVRARHGAEARAAASPREQPPIAGSRVMTRHRVPLRCSARRSSS